MRKCALSAAVMLMAFATTVSAKDIDVGALPDSVFADTEVSTNVSFNAGRNDTRVFDVRIESGASVSNDIQVAFGRDLDADGDLYPDEASLVLGWQNGRCFVEDVGNWVRTFADPSSSVSDGRFLAMHVTTDARFRPKSASFTNESGECFPDVGVGSWLFCRDWNLMKVTRRGVEAPSEWCRVTNVHSRFSVFVR